MKGNYWYDSCCQGHRKLFYAMLSKNVDNSIQIARIRTDSKVNSPVLNDSHNICSLKSREAILF